MRYFGWSLDYIFNHGFTTLKGWRYIHLYRLAEYDLANYEANNSNLVDIRNISGKVWLQAFRPVKQHYKIKWNECLMSLV